MNWPGNILPVKCALAVLLPADPETQMYFMDTCCKLLHWVFTSPTDTSLLRDLEDFGKDSFSSILFSLC